MKGKVACIGAGTVGHAWAVVFARAGYEVALYDAKPDEVARSRPARRPCDPGAARARRAALGEPVDDGR